MVAGVPPNHFSWYNPTLTHRVISLQGPARFLQNFSVEAAQAKTILFVFWRFLRSSPATYLDRDGRTTNSYNTT